MGSYVRLVALLASALVLFGFAYFATDEMSRGSKNQQNQLDAALKITQDPAPVAPSPVEEEKRERINGPVREAIADANDVLLRPFTMLVDGSNDRWVTHGVPALLALLLYGVGLGMLANMLPKHREHGTDWRTA